MMKRLLIALLAVPCFALAVPQAAVEEGNLRIVLTDEPCGLKAEVVNLPLRATWTESGKAFEGCYMVNNGIVVFYFADKTVAVAPLSAFARVMGI